MWILVVYNDLKKEKINGLIYFSKKKDILRYTNGIIAYTDFNTRRNKAYQTYKNLFSFIYIPNHHTIKYFCDNFY